MDSSIVISRITMITKLLIGGQDTDNDRIDLLRPIAQHG